MLVLKLKAKGKSCHNFTDVPADPDNSEADPEEQMKNYEAPHDFYNNSHFQYLFKKDLEALKDAKNAILLLPAGISGHIEIGIAFGLNKPVTLIGEATKPESLYLMFKNRYKTIDEFIASL